MFSIFSILLPSFFTPIFIFYIVLLPQLESTVSSLTNSLHQLETEKQGNNNDENDDNDDDKMKVLETELQAIEIQLQDANNFITSLQKTLDKTSATNTKLGNKNKELQSKYQQLQNESSIAKQKCEDDINQLKTEKQSLQSNCELKDNEINRLKTNEQSLIGEKKKLQDVLKEHQKHLVVLKSMLNDRDHLIEKLQNENANLKSKLQLQLQNLQFTTTDGATTINIDSDLLQSQQTDDGRDQRDQYDQGISASAPVLLQSMPSSPKLEYYGNDGNDVNTSEFDVDSYDGDLLSASRVHLRSEPAESIESTELSDDRTNPSFYTDDNTSDFTDKTGTTDFTSESGESGDSNATDETDETTTPTSSSSWNPFSNLLSALPANSASWLGLLALGLGSAYIIKRSLSRRNPNGGNIGADLSRLGLGASAAMNAISSGTDTTFSSVLQSLTQSAARGDTVGFSFGEGAASSGGKISL